MSTIRRLIVGPPGTGKTTRCLKIVNQEIDAGTPIDQIAYVTFGRAATEHVRARANAQWGHLAEVSELAFRGFKTIHALAYDLLALRRERVMGAQHWTAFGRLHGYKFTGGPSIEDGVMVGPTRTKDDQLRAVYDWGRNLELDMTTALARSPLSVNRYELTRFVERVEAYKKRHRLLDFVDMLLEVLRRGLRPFFNVAIVDEAQDLSPLQVSVISQWFKHSDRLYVAGDDDQAIYEFQGGDASWLLEFAKTAETEVLRQSWRVPHSVHEVAHAIIRRNRQRLEKPYRPRDASGQVDWLTFDQALRALEPKSLSFVLGRNRCFLDEVATELRRLGLPFVLECGASPLDPDRGVARALRASLAIGRGEPVIASDLAAMLSYVPSRDAGLVPHGTKAKVDRMRAGDRLIPAEVAGLLRGGTLMDVITTNGAASVLQKADKADLDYVQHVFATHGERFDPQIRLTTIHGAKGREADTVVVLPDMTRATFEGSRDVRHGGEAAENRVGYVAVTRTKHRLVLVRPRTMTCFAYPTRASRASAKDAQEDEAA